MTDVILESDHNVNETVMSARLVIVVDLSFRSATESRIAVKVVGPVAGTSSKQRVVEYVVVDAQEGVGTRLRMSPVRQDW
jgi:hypothetical protein